MFVSFVVNFQQNLRSFQTNVLTVGQALIISRGILRGLTYLHEERWNKEPKATIIHRDLKSSNVLLKSDLTPCLCDFGLAIVCENGQPEIETQVSYLKLREKRVFSYFLQNHQVGTVRYMSPELLSRMSDFTPSAFRAIDVYACALVLWETMCRTSWDGGPPQVQFVVDNDKLSAISSICLTCTHPTSRR